MRILVVDDDELLVDLVVQILDLHGYTCEKAYDGQEGLTKALNSFYPLVISDVRMPKMTGPEFLMELRKNQAGDHKSRFMIMTAYASEEIMDEVKKWDANAFILKPFDLQEFVKVVQKLLQKV